MRTTVELTYELFEHKGDYLTIVTASVIRNDEDLAEAIARVEELWGVAVGTPKGDELDVGIALVHDYESRNQPMEPPTPIEAVEGLMDRMGLSRRDLLPIFGTHGRLSEFLKGKRSLSKTQVKALHAKYRISYDSLMG